MKALKGVFLLCSLLCITWFGSYAQESTLKEGKQVSINGTRLFVKTIGSGEPIIIIHGGPVLDHSYLLPHLKSLAGSNRLLFYDQRLSGRSAAVSDSADIRLQTFIEDIEAIRSFFNYEQVHILAHSWGGLLAMNFAIRYPSRVQSLILMNSMPPSSDLWKKEEAILAQKVSGEDSLARQEIMQSELFKKEPAKAIEKLLLLSFKKQFHNESYADKLNLYVPDDYMARSRLFGNLMKDITQYDLTDELKNINTPTLIIYGNSEPASVLSGPILHRHIPDSKLSIIKECGHFPFIEQPRKFHRVVADFLNTVSSNEKKN